MIDGSIHRVAPIIMDDIVTPVNNQDSSSSRIAFPSWLGQSQKVMFSKNGVYVKGIMEFDLDSNGWRFSQHRRNGQEL